MKSYTKSIAALALSAGIIATASVAGSHSSKTMDPAVAARHSQMQIVGYSIGILGAVAKGEMAYDAAMVASAAANINAMAKLDRATLWTSGTEQGAAEGSRSKAEVWSDPAGFDAKFQGLADASAALMTAADAAAVGAGMGALGGACKACHETYRGPKN